MRALKVDEKKLGADHLDTAKDLIVLANLYRDTAQYAKAEPLYQRALKIREKSLGPNHINRRDDVGRARRALLGKRPVSKSGTAVATRGGNSRAQ